MDNIDERIIEEFRALTPEEKEIFAFYFAEMLENKLIDTED